MALIGTLTSGVNALRTFSKGLEVIGNNISNVNTTGYKSSTATFADTFSNTLRAASSASGDAAIQVGTGVQISGIATNYTQGALSSTGNGTDLAISGAGYFVVQDGTLNYATRDGAFKFDDNGFLVNAQGYKVLDVDGDPVEVTDYADKASVTIGSDGKITVFEDDGTTTAGPTIGILKFTDQGKLMKRGNNLFDFGATGADVTADMGAPASPGFGSIQTGRLELSNVDLTDQFSELITTQRSFQAGSRLITVSDSVLEDIVNLKR